MSDISDLESRITAALDRISYGISKLDTSASAGESVDVSFGQAPADDGRIADLEAKLDEERTANAQLEERIKVLKEREGGAQEVYAAIEAAKSKLVRYEKDLNRLREVNAELRDVNGKLRAAMENGVADAEMINRAMAAELDALRAVRDADATEVDAVLDALKPILEEAH